jgi:7-carboxy-7-deazaguanine synthase
VTGVARDEHLRITEIFLSLQGETTFVGLPTVFVRLTGCPLRCGYCDTAYAFSGGTLYRQEEVLDVVAQHGVRHVTVTGGEPLAQPAAIPLLRALCELGYTVSLETSGAMDVAAVDPRVTRILDIKTPGSGEVGRNRWENMPLCGRNDQVKFVICSRADYEWAKLKCDELRLTERFGEVLFSPAAEALPAAALADWIVADRLPVRFQLQLHKILWNNEPGR